MESHSSSTVNQSNIVNSSIINNSKNMDIEIDNRDTRTGKPQVGVYVPKAAESQARREDEPRADPDRFEPILDHKQLFESYKMSGESVEEAESECSNTFRTITEAANEEDEETCQKAHYSHILS